MLRVANHHQPARRAPGRNTAMRYSQRHLVPRPAPQAAAPSTLRVAPAMRALVLLLITLLLVFIGLMNITGGYHVGGPVLGSILLIGIGAANYAR
ncbi:MAG TPA: hypothetical protein VFU22_08540 [Roseiflexaceae bacterium]|nr:hypothetical protein [Roseiflexaceae bacterium]